MWLVSLVEVTRCYLTLHSPKNTDEPHALTEFDFHLDWSVAIVFKAREEIGFQYLATEGDHRLERDNQNFAKHVKFCDNLINHDYKDMCRK